MPTRYLLLDELGRGAASRVHLAWDRASRVHVAVKVPRSSPPPPPVPFSHPHVLAHTVVGAVAAMPLVRGGTLLDLCARVGRLPEAYAAVVLDQLLQALAESHRHGVVHRDVKAANLLLDATGTGRPRLRLADFGDASTWGTAGYVAPEREAGAAATPDQDVYAAGVLARRLLARPGPLVTLAGTMTSPDPSRRPTAVVALARLRTLPVPRADSWPPVPDRLGPLTRRRRPRLRWAT